MKIKSALKAAAVAATLVFSGASHAAIGYASHDLGLVLDDGGSMLHGNNGGQPIETYDLTGTTLGAAILAFCVQPTVEQVGGTVYTQGAAVSSLGALFADSITTTSGTITLANRGARVQSLFENNYNGLHSTTDRLGFALALWDLVADDGNLGTGRQAFTSDASAFDAYTGDEISLATAQTMLNGATGTGLTGAFKYTLFTGKVGTTEVGSQNLLSVSAVPEADTWAMMVVGLGLVGFMGRRKSDKSEKFAA